MLPSGLADEIAGKPNHRTLCHYYRSEDIQIELPTLLKEAIITLQLADKEAEKKGWCYREIMFEYDDGDASIFIIGWVPKTLEEMLGKANRDNSRKSQTMRYEKDQLKMLLAKYSS